jgi:hypothetical protein
MPRFRIKTLLFFTAIIAIGIFLWMQFVAPRIAGATVRNFKLLVYLKGSSPRLGDPYDYESFREPSWIDFFTPRDDVFLHDAYAIVEIPVLTILLLIGITAFLISGFLFSPLWLGKRRNPPKSAPPGA